MRTVITSIPHSSQRYVTCGDYFYEQDGTLQVFVSETGDWRMNFLIALHEIIEANLCEHAGIAEADVLAFDLAHPELDDPGHDPRAIYHQEHVFAEIVERAVAQRLNVNWQEYEKRLGEL